MAGSAGRMNRPFGVALIALLMAVSVLITLVQLARIGELPEDQAKAFQPWVTVVGAWQGLGLMAAAGLFALRRWGMWLTIFYFAGSTLYVVLTLPRLDLSASGIAPVVFKVGFFVLAIWYLTSRDTRAAFRRGR